MLATLALTDLDGILVFEATVGDDEGESLVQASVIDAKGGGEG